VTPGQGRRDSDFVKMIINEALADMPPLRYPYPEADGWIPRVKWDRA